MLEISSKLENKRDNNNIISKQDKNSWLQYQKYQANIFTENKNKYSGDINKKTRGWNYVKKVDLVCDSIKTSMCNIFSYLAKLFICS